MIAQYAETIFFFLFALGALGGCTGVILYRHPIHSALSLIVGFFFMAGLYLLLNAQFMAILQILVYAGAIMVLFVFVLMLLNLHEDELGAEKYSVHTLLGGAVAVSLLLALISSIMAFSGSGQQLYAEQLPTDFGTVAPVGHALLTTHVLPFELAAVLLLVGIVGAVVVARKRG